MPKKKVAKPVKKATGKKAVTKSSPVSKSGTAKSSPKKVIKKKAAGKGSATKSSAVERASTKATPPTAATTSSPSSNGEVSLGRPLVTQEEKLYMLFHDDYQARQVFEFLRVENIKELEQFSPQQIVHMMSKPLRTTVDRIRQRLAQYKRSLKDDEQFAADYLKKAE